jgi:hypothetical protein
MHTPPLFFCPFAIWPSGVNKSQSSIGFQKSVTFEIKFWKWNPRSTARAACRAANVQGGNPSDKPCDVTAIIAFRSPDSAHGNLFRAREIPHLIPSLMHGGSYSWTSAVSMKFQITGSAYPGARAAGRPAPR